MQNKGFVKVFAVLLTLVCVFYLSFSFVTRYHMNKAAQDLLIAVVFRYFPSPESGNYGKKVLNSVLISMAASIFSRRKKSWI